MISGNSRNVSCLSPPLQIMCVKQGNQVLKEHFEKAPQNAKYNSTTIQNELICVTGEWITQTIVSEIKGRFINVLADETADIHRTDEHSTKICRQ